MEWRAGTNDRRPWRFLSHVTCTVICSLCRPETLHRTPRGDALPLNPTKFYSTDLMRKGCPTTVWPTDVAKPLKMGWHCTNSPRTLRSFANGRSRCNAPVFIGLPHQTPTSAVSILGRSILNRNQPQALWNWGLEQLLLCSSVHIVPPAMVLAVWSACLLSSGGV